MVIILFNPGTALGLHYHNKVEETFYFISGKSDIFIDDKKYTACDGDLFRIEPGEKHNIVNTTDKDCKVMFIKCPYIPDDKVNC